MKILQNPSKVGGPGPTVKFDKCKFSKHKYNRGTFTVFRIIQLCECETEVIT